MHLVYISNIYKCRINVRFEKKIRVSNNYFISFEHIKLFIQNYYFFNLYAIIASFERIECNFLVIFNFSFTINYGKINLTSI